MRVVCQANQPSSRGDDGEVTAKGLDSAENGLTTAEPRGHRDLFLEHGDCFVGASRPLACTSLLSARPDTSHHAKNSQWLRRFRGLMRSAARDLGDKLHEVATAERSNSGRGSAILVTKKPGGGLSLRGDNGEV